MEECCICLDLLKTDITILKCLHKFHTKCLYDNFKYSNTCPLCRQDMYIIARVDACIVNESLTYVKYKKQKHCIIL